MDRIKNHFQEAARLLDQFYNDDRQLALIKQAGDAMVNAFQNGNKLITCGNGGSMCDAMHMAEELSGRYRNDRPPLPAVAISDPSYLSCVSNDYGFDHTFSRFVEGMAVPGDILAVITTSGNSPNIIHAMKAGRSKSAYIIAFTGKGGGKAAALADSEIRVPDAPYADRAQELHIKIIHSLIDHVEYRMFSEHKSS